jgi:hypothetical protein
LDFKGRGSSFKGTDESVRLDSKEIFVDEVAAIVEEA